MQASLTTVDTKAGAQTIDLVGQSRIRSQRPLLIRIFDVAGRQVSSSKIDAKDMENGLINLNVANINTGMYNLNFVLGGKNLGSIPFVKQ